MKKSLLPPDDSQANTRRPSRSRFFGSGGFCLLAVIGSFAILPFHADEAPGEEYRYDRIESSLQISLTAPQGTVLKTPTASKTVEVFVERLSWEIWILPSVGAASEESRNPTRGPAPYVEGTFYRSPDLGSLASQTLYTDWTGRATTTFTGGGTPATVVVTASAEGSTSSIAFEWTDEHEAIRNPSEPAARWFQRTWENPTPGVAIVSVDFIAVRAAAHPSIYAITVEP